MKSKSESPVSWAPRVSREKILELYIKVAGGNNDEELIDDVAQAFYNRCSDIVRIYERRFACPQCREELPYPHLPDTDLYCSECGWRMPWREYFRTYQRKQLSVNADNTTMVRQFLNDLPGCKSPQEKMVLIDSIIHACHEIVTRRESYYTRPLAVNLIDGTMHQVIAFLENLPEGPDTLPEMNQQLIEWRRRCLSIFTDIEAERDKIRHLVDSMPPELKAEIEEMLTQNHRQKAAARLKKIEEYSGEVYILRGDVARQMVKMIEKRIKERQVRD